MIKVHLLSITAAPYTEALFSALNAEDYGNKATILTIGLETTKEVSRNHLRSIELTGETATGPDGDPAKQTSYDTAWTNDDRTYRIYVIRIGGEVDPSKVDITISGKTDGVQVAKKFENNGEAIGFEAAIKAFEDKEHSLYKSSIVKLKDRHYIITRVYTSSSGFSSLQGVDCSTQKLSYVLIPIEDGFAPTLKNDDVKMVVDGTVNDTAGRLLVNLSGMVDASTLECQTTIEVKVFRRLVEPTESDGTHSAETYEQAQKDINKYLELVTFEISNSDGSITVLKASDD